MNEYIKDFIVRRRDLIEAGDYQKLFYTCFPNDTSHLADALIKANINFLDRMHEIIPNMFSYNETGGKLIIPPSIIKIGEHAFEMAKFKSIGISDDSTAPLVLEDHCFQAMPNLETLKLSKRIKSIPPYFVAFCPKLISIEIPEGVYNIDNNAFENSTIAQIKLPSTIRSIGLDAFNANGMVEILYNGTEEEWNEIFNIDDKSDIIVRYLK